MAGTDMKFPLKAIEPALKNSFFFSVFIWVVSFLLFSSHSAQAVETAPTPEMVARAVQNGKAQHVDIKKLFDLYTFGKLGVDVNGLVLTKLFEISQLAAESVAQGKEPDTKKIDEILKKDYLLFALTLVASDEKAFEPLKVEMRQALKTLTAAEVLKDKPEKMLCEKDVCVYKMDVYVGFYYSDFDPRRISVLALKYGSRTIDIPIPLDSFK